MTKVREIWKDIPGFEGFYKINRNGNVLSIRNRPKSKVKNKVIDRPGLLKILTGNGYKYFKAWIYGKSTHVLIHRAIAQCFIPNPENKPHVNHKNANRSDNRIRNLEWVTPKENAMHAWNMGLYQDPPKFWLGKRGKSHIRSKPINRINTDGRIIKRYENACFAAEDLGLDRRTVSKVACGKLKHIKGFLFKFA